MKRSVAVITGAGISADSGLRTFRDSGGLWEGYAVHEVATPEAWSNNPRLVLEFYNERRRQMRQAEPNEAHQALVRLELQYAVHIITQNVDDLHERAGSTNVLHLHGELAKARSCVNSGYVVEINGDIKLGDRCPEGGQLRPHIVWFGESVPLIEDAQRIVEQAEIVLVVGTSLQVYPAAGLIDYATRASALYVVDPRIPPVTHHSKVIGVSERASIGVPMVVEEILS